MGNFCTIEGIRELFERVNFIGAENCFFYCITNKQSPAAGMAGGALGGMVAAMTNKAWDAYLVNQTEKGIGLIPLKNTKPLFSTKVENMVPQLDCFTFLDKYNIASVKIGRFGLISPVAKSLVIKLGDGSKYNLIVNNKEKLIPYHEANFAEFVKKYK